MAIEDCVENATDSICSLTEVRGITNRKTVIEGYENVQAALLDYTLTCYPSVTVSHPAITPKNKSNPLLPHPGQVQQVAQYYSRDPRHRNAWRRASLHETLCWKCTITDATYGNASCETKII
jgi:hypothetical protein